MSLRWLLAPLFVLSCREPTSSEPQRLTPRAGPTARVAPSSAALPASSGSCAPGDWSAVPVAPRCKLQLGAHAALSWRPCPAGDDSVPGCQMIDGARVAEVRAVSVADAATLAVVTSCDATSRLLVGQLGDAPWGALASECPLSLAGLEPERVRVTIDGSPFAFTRGAERAQLSPVTDAAPDRAVELDGARLAATGTSLLVTRGAGPAQRLAPAGRAELLSSLAGDGKDAALLLVAPGERIGRPCVVHAIELGANPKLRRVGSFGCDDHPETPLVVGHGLAAHRNTERAIVLVRLKDGATWSFGGRCEPKPSAGLCVDRPLAITATELLFSTRGPERLARVPLAALGTPEPAAQPPRDVPLTLVK